MTFTGSWYGLLLIFPRAVSSLRTATYRELEVVNGILNPAGSQQVTIDGPKPQVYQGLVKGFRDFTAMLLRVV